MLAAFGLRAVIVIVGLLSEPSDETVRVAIREETKLILEKLSQIKMEIVSKRVVSECANAC